MIKLAIVLSHPVQYYSPVFVQLAKSVKLSIKVFYCLESNDALYDRGFGKAIQWDVPLLEGYDYQFSRNSSSDPGTHHFYGLDNPELIQEVDSWKPDAIMIYGWKYKTNLNLLKYFKGKIPLFFRGDSHLLDNNSLFEKELREFILRWVYRKVDFAFYTGINNKSYFKEAGLQEHQLIWAPHSIDNNRFDDDGFRYAEEAENWRTDLAIKKSDTVVLFAGKLEDKKQPLFLLEVAKQLGDVNFIFVGNGQHEAIIQNTSLEYGNIHYMPFQNQSKMPVVYRMCDIFCLPSSREESWGLAVNEAMACGRAILASNKVGCAADLVKNGENGFIFNADNSEELRQVIYLLKDEKELLKKLGENSNEIIKNWSVEKQAEAIERGITSNVNLINEPNQSFSIIE